jgi:hypothetical protein
LLELALLIRQWAFLLSGLSVIAGAFLVIHALWTQRLGQRLHWAALLLARFARPGVVVAALPVCWLGIRVTFFLVNGLRVVLLRALRFLSLPVWCRHSMAPLVLLQYGASLLFLVALLAASVVILYVCWMV